jgi:hypothetical protein
MEQITVIEPSTGDLADHLLAADGVFHVLIVDQYSNLVVNRAKDVDVSEKFLKSFHDATMRIVSLRTSVNVDTDPVGTYRSALLEYDRVTILLIPDDDRTVGIALLKEHATAGFIDHARVIIGNSHTT